MVSHKTTEGGVERRGGEVPFCHAARVISSRFQEIHAVNKFTKRRSLKCAIKGKCECEEGQVSIAWQIHNVYLSFLSDR